MNQRTYVTKQMLKDRGWTETLIRRFLSYPDKEEPNPVNKRGATMKLYLISRVRNIENSPEFEEALLASAKRRRSRQREG